MNGLSPVGVIPDPPIVFRNLINDMLTGALNDLPLRGVPDSPEAYTEGSIDLRYRFCRGQAVASRVSYLAERIPLFWLLEYEEETNGGESRGDW
jgi:hypothetical protein